MPPNTGAMVLLRTRDKIVATALATLRPGLEWSPAELLLAQAFAEALLTRGLNTHLLSSPPEAGNWLSVEPSELTPGSEFSLGFMSPVEDAAQPPQLHVRCTAANGTRQGTFTARVDKDGLVCSNDGDRFATEPASGAARIIHRWLTDAMPPRAA